MRPSDIPVSHANLYASLDCLAVLVENTLGRMWVQTCTLTLNWPQQLEYLVPIEGELVTTGASEICA